MISLIVIFVVLSLVYVMPIFIAWISARCISLNIANQEGKFSRRYADSIHDYSSPRRLMLSDVLTARSLSLWLLPILLFGALAVPLEFAARGEFWGTSEAESFDPGMLGAIVMEVTLLSSTIGLAIWWLDKSNQGVRHAGIYAVCAWVVARSVWFLPHPFALRELTKIHLDLTHVFGGEFGVGFATGMACIAATLAIVSALNDWSTILQRSLLVFAVPFVVMHWIVEEISFAVLFWDVTYAGMILGAVIWLRRSRLRYDMKDVNDQCRLGLRRSLSLVVAALVIVTAILVRMILTPPNDTSTLWTIAMPWLLIFALSILFYVLVRWLSEIEDSKSWSVLVFLLCLVVIHLPAHDAWYPASVNDNLALWFPMDWHVVAIGILGAVALLVSLLPDRWRDARAYMVGMCWPAVFQVTLTVPIELEQVPDLDIAYLVGPSVAMAVVFGMMVSVFGSDRLHREAGGRTTG